MMLLKFKGGRAAMIRWGKLLSFIILSAVIIAVTALTAIPISKGITLGLDLQGGFEVLYQLVPLKEGTKITSDIQKETAAALNERVNVLGVSEPRIDIEGSDRVRVQLAGVKDQDNAREILGTPAKLTFRNDQGEILMDGDDLAPGGAKVGFDPRTSMPLVEVKLKDAGKFEKITREYLHQRIGIYLDENMLSNPEVQDVISGGVATISGNFTVESATQLADLLNAGALPVNLKEISSNSVGASLGQLSMQQTIFAGAVGTALIYLFMLLFYRLPGLVAVVALTAYIYLILVTFNLMHVTLTLPGIAAFVLGIGMAVDANIITYERIKEEIRSGKSLLSSLKAGSRRALGTILDANITTIIAALVLFYFGSSSIKGFAVTLIVSIIISVVTAVYGTRLLLNLIVRSNVAQKPWWYGVKGEEISEL
jgi:protein-export SecD/SecF family membrane protein